MAMINGKWIVEKIDNVTKQHGQYLSFSRIANLHYLQKERRLKPKKKGKTSTARHSQVVSCMCMAVIHSRLKAALETVGSFSRFLFHTLLRQTVESAQKYGL